MAIEIKEVPEDGLLDVAIVDYPCTVVSSYPYLGDYDNYVDFPKVDLNEAFVAEVADEVRRSKVCEKKYISSYLQRESLQSEKERRPRYSRKINRWVIAIFRNRQFPVVVPIFGIWSPAQAIESAELYRSSDFATVNINGNTEIPGFPSAQDARLIINELVERHAAARK